MFKDFISALFKKGKGFTPLEIQESLSLFKGSKAKPPNGLALSTKKFNGKFLMGFTLIELMVVMVIISIITAVVLANYRAGGRQLALDRSANKLAQDIRRAQGMAMSVKEVNGSMPHGFGIVMIIAGPPIPLKSTTRYYLYTDMDGDQEFSSSPPDEIISEIDLEKGVAIDTIDVLGTPPAALHWGIINFSPPDPEINIVKNSGMAGNHHGIEMRITLALEVDPSKNKIIKVNNAGLIYVE